MEGGLTGGRNETNDERKIRGKLRTLLSRCIGAGNALAILSELLTAQARPSINLIPALHELSSVNKHH